MTISFLATEILMTFKGGSVSNRGEETTADIEGSDQPFFIRLAPKALPLLLLSVVGITSGVFFGFRTN